MAGGGTQGLVRGVLPVHEPIEAHSDGGRLGSGTADRVVGSGPTPEAAAESKGTAQAGKVTEKC